MAWAQWKRAAPRPSDRADAATRTASTCILRAPPRDSEAKKGQLEGGDDRAVGVLGDSEELVRVGVDPLERGQVRREVVAGLALGTQRVVTQQVDDGRDVLAFRATHPEAATSGLDDVHDRQSVIRGDRVSGGSARSGP